MRLTLSTIKQELKLLSRSCCQWKTRSCRGRLLFQSSSSRVRATALRHGRLVGVAGFEAAESRKKEKCGGVRVTGAQQSDTPEEMYGLGRLVSRGPVDDGTMWKRPCPAISAHHSQFGAI
ncbi:hypothetical protein MRX96_020191 [Rhipicephalus microplus]